MEGFTTVTAANDAEKDVHYLSPGSLGVTLCGLKKAASSTGELTCYRCHELAVGI
jgi:hypothetical protein